MTVAFYQREHLFLPQFFPLHFEIPIANKVYPIYCPIDPWKLWYYLGWVFSQFFRIRYIVLIPQFQSLSLSSLFWCRSYPVSLKFCIPPFFSFFCTWCLLTEPSQADDISFVTYGTTITVSLSCERIKAKTVCKVGCKRKVGTWVSRNFLEAAMMHIFFLRSNCCLLERFRFVSGENLRKSHAVHVILIW